MSLPCEWKERKVTALPNQIICDNCMSCVDEGLAECPFCGAKFENRNPRGTLPAYSLLAGRYTIGACIAVDGEGVTYQAIDSTNAHRVVIKEYVPVTMCAARTREGAVVPRPGKEVLFKTTRMDFVDLYRSLVTLGRTEGLVTVLDLVETNNTAYAVREPDEGETLQSYLDSREEPLTQEEALMLLRPVVYGVEAMHRMGLLHRGISPETVFITPAGAKLSGYATLGLRNAGGELKSQLVEGYAAPEQYAVAEFDGKYTDIYSLGALFYRALTGHTPLAANLRRTNDNMLPAHRVNRELPGYVSTAIGRAMRLNPSERPQSASDLLAAITAPTKLDSRFHLTSRQWKFIGIAAAGLVLVLALSIWAISSALGGGKEEESSSISSSVSESQSSSSQSSSSQSVAQKVSVPNFLGETYQDIIDSDNYTEMFLFTTEYEYSDDYDEGKIIRQEPAFGNKVSPGATIKLYVSKGPEYATIPTNIVGLSKGDAQQVLSELNVLFEIVEVDNPGGTYKAYTVVKTEPEAGQKVKMNETVVKLYVAKEATPASSESTPESSSSQPTTETPSSSTEQTQPASGN